ncbi:MAG: 50S ribosomal protein L25/general stress protein Ctc [Luteimonas sp.]
MSEHKLTATGRKDEGKGASRRLRHAARLPAVVYGGKSDPQSIEFEHEKIWQASQHEWFYSSIVDLDIDGKVEPVLLRDMQRHPYKQQIMHLDFLRVNANETLRAYVPLHLLNADKSPAGKTAGVVIMHELTQVEVSCLPKDLPANLEVDLSELKLGDTIHMSQIKLPEGVEIPALKLGPDHDAAVVVARHGRVEEEPAEAEEVVAVPAIKAADPKDDDK